MNKKTTIQFSIEELTIIREKSEKLAITLGSKLKDRQIVMYAINLL